VKKSLDEIYAGIAKAIVAYSDKPDDIVNNLGIVQIYPLYGRTIIVTRRPGVLIGKKGRLIDKISEQIGKVEVIEEDSATHEEHIAHSADSIQSADQQFLEVTGKDPAKCSNIGTYRNRQFSDRQIIAETKDGKPWIWQE